jgi:hypothetical protein
VTDLSKEDMKEQQRRVIELVRRKEGVKCPELVINDSYEGPGPARVNYTCREGDPSKDLIPSQAEALFIRLDRSPARAEPKAG